METRKYAAEAIGTFWLTLGGCGSAVIAAGFAQVGIGLLGVSFAFGLTVVTMAGPMRSATSPAAISTRRSRSGWLLADVFLPALSRPT